MGVCLHKDVAICHGIPQASTDSMPTSSTARLNAANKRVSLPGKTTGKKHDRADWQRPMDNSKDSSDASLPATKTSPDASGDSSRAKPVINRASVQPNGFGASGKIAEGEGQSSAPTNLVGIVARSENASQPSDTSSASVKKKQGVMGNSSSSAKKNRQNGSKDALDSAAPNHAGPPTAEMENSEMLATGKDLVADYKGWWQQPVTLTEAAPAFTMPKIPDLTKPAPDFCGQAVVDGQFKEIKLSDYKGKYLVLFFYPLDFTFVCPTEIISFSDRIDEFRKVNCELIACSTDSQYSHFAWVNTSRKQGGLGALNIPLLADKTGQIARDYGCFKEDEGIAFRGLYIIDDKGRLRQITINDLPVGRSVDEALRLVQAFQFTDKYGEVCPAGWKPGEKSMKPDPTGSKEYFQDKH